jgi:HAD superfamily hydrolase (TIGR01509 family)
MVLPWFLWKLPVRFAQVPMSLNAEKLQTVNYWKEKHAKNRTQTSEVDDLLCRFHNTRFSMNIVDRLYLPDSTQAVLWDMDGILIDSLSFAIEASNTLIKDHFGPSAQLDPLFVKTIFPFDPPIFWQKIVQQLDSTGHVNVTGISPLELSHQYVSHRARAPFPVHVGIPEILSNLRLKGIKCAVVSNNPIGDILQIIKNCSLLGHFDVFVGNDNDKLRKKPAPDTYLEAALMLRIDPIFCAVIEDSTIGVSAGTAAGCYTVAVATGSADFATLACSRPDRVYNKFSCNSVKISFGDVRNKRISTPNEFVSHMVEHIAWRLGSIIDFSWNNNDYFAAGVNLGSAISDNPRRLDSSACLGMIDDGSAEVLVDFTEKRGSLHLEAVGEISLDWFLALRCEQIDDGRPLVALLEGLAEGLGARMVVRVCSLEDPHHTWEGIFRSVGISLSRIYTPTPESIPDAENDVATKDGDISVRRTGLHLCEVRRKTAESDVYARIDLSRKSSNSVTFDVGPTISVDGIESLLYSFAENAGFSLQLMFGATFLSSSHVVFEDAALVIGRALLELLTARMNVTGAQGAGSNIQSSSDFVDLSIGVGVSVEGRKFWSFVPFEQSYFDLRRSLLVGQDVNENLRSEDLDDFVDGLAGGLSASIMIHVRKVTDANTAWPLIFAGLGTAIKEAFSLNIYRRGVPPGVKATLA